MSNQKQVLKQIQTSFFTLLTILTFTALTNQSFAHAESDVLRYKGNCRAIVKNNSRLCVTASCRCMFGTSTLREGESCPTDETIALRDKDESGCITDSCDSAFSGKAEEGEDISPNALALYAHWFGGGTPASACQNWHTPDIDLMNEEDAAARKAAPNAPEIVTRVLLAQSIVRANRNATAAAGSSY